MKFTITNLLGIFVIIVAIIPIALIVELVARSDAPAN